MHQRRLYAVAFLLVLLAAIGGAYLATRVVGPVTVPRLDLLESAQQILVDLDFASLLPRIGPSSDGASAQPTAEPTVLSAQPSPQAIVEQNTVPTAETETTVAAAITATAELSPIATAAAGAAPVAPTERPTATPAPPTPTPTAAPQPPAAAMPFAPVSAVRHSSGDCPGPSIRGTVRDAAGNPLAGVRLWRYDQWGNDQTVESKSGAGDLGQYDFPLGDTPNVHYVQVVDAAGSAISPVVEVQHRQGSAPDATCHWIDWVRR